MPNIVNLYKRNKGELKTRREYLNNVVQISVHDTEGIIKTFLPKHSTGQDEIPTYLVKECIKWIKHPLKNIINSSFKSGKNPTQLKIAKKVPILKKGSNACKENYRPVALLSNSLKIVGSVVYN